MITMTWEILWMPVATVLLGDGAGLTPATDPHAVTAATVHVASTTPRLRRACITAIVGAPARRDLRGR
jgi:hypothetical protein